jgi:hypothetical protein
MLAEGPQNRSATRGGVIRHVGILLQDDIRGVSHQLSGAEWPNLLIAEHGGAQNDAQRDLIKVVGISQSTMKFRQERVGDDSCAFERVIRFPPRGFVVIDSLKSG